MKSKRKSNGIGIKGSSKPNGDIRKAKKAVSRICLKDIALTLHIKIKHIAYTCHEKWEFQDAR